MVTLWMNRDGRAMPLVLKRGAEIGAFHMWKFAGFDDKGDFLLYNKDGEVIPASQKSVDDKTIYR